MFIRKFKSVIGVLIILMAVAGLYFWETTGRQVALTEEVVMSKESIAKGQEITQDMLKVQPVLKENIASTVIMPSEERTLVGEIALCDIAKNSQLTKGMIGNSEKPDEDLSSFVLQGDWIYQRSAALRQGDVIKVYNENLNQSFGEFTISYVKDRDEKEVVSESSKEGSSIWKRSNGSGTIDNVEIMCKLEDYKGILSYMSAHIDDLNENAHGLILIQVNR